MKIIVFGECIYTQTANGVVCLGNHIEVALHAAKLGADVAFISAVDTSPLADLALAYLNENGIDTTHVARLSTPPEETDVVFLPFESIPLPKRLPDADLCYFTARPLRGLVSENTLKTLLTLGEYPTVAADFTAYSAPLDTLYNDAVLSQSTILRFSSDNPAYLNRGMDDFSDFMREKFPSLHYFYTEPSPDKTTFYDAETSIIHDCELPKGLASEFWNNRFLTTLLCAVSGGHEPEDAIENAKKLMRHICEKGESLPYPKSLCHDVIPPLYTTRPKKTRPSKGNLLTTVYAILISVAFIVSTSFAAYFFIALQYPYTDMEQYGETEEEQQENTHSFPPLSERPLYTGDDITVPDIEQSQSTPLLTSQEIIEMTKPSVVCVLSDLGEGTGFILTETGYIVTNHHIVDQSTRFTVILHDDTVYDAHFVGSDELTDIAVLKIEPGDTPLRPIPLGNSEAIREGDAVIAIGSPGGSQFAGTATGGMVSAAYRRLTTSALSGDGSRTLWVIQTDTAVNFGSSGGPLLNMRGQIIGINTLKYAELYFEGLGFSLPINGVMDIVNILMKNGAVTEYPQNCFAKSNVSLGITVTPLTKAQLEENNISYGLLVESVATNSNAALDGVLAGDIVLAIDGKEANSSLQLRNIVYDHYAGEKLTLRICRNKKTLDITITLRDQTKNK